DRPAHHLPLSSFPTRRSSDLLAWKIAQSPRVSALFAAPGNPGIARHAVCVPLAADALDDLLALARRERIDLTVVGPEAPLVAGRSEEHTSELQSRVDLVCRLL